ncbi:MAG: hypothetical protein JXR07_01270 [Reichenbachiella sp.]
MAIPMKNDNVNYIKHMNGWFEKVSNDDRLNPTHVSLYFALFQFWNFNRFDNPISIARSEMMKLSRIGSKSTYTKCMKDLHNWKYIEYKPSFNPTKGSLVNMYDFGKGTGNSTGKGSGKGHGIVLVPSINSNKHNKQYKHINSNVNQNKNFNEPL